MFGKRVTTTSTYKAVRKSHSQSTIKSTSFRQPSHFNSLNLKHILVYRYLLLIQLKETF